MAAASEIARVARGLGGQGAIFRGKMREWWRGLAEVLGRGRKRSWVSPTLRLLCGGTGIVRGGSLVWRIEGAGGGVLGDLRSEDVML